MANSSFYKNSKLYELDLSGLLFLVNWPGTRTLSGGFIWHYYGFWWNCLVLSHFLVD